MQLFELSVVVLVLIATRCQTKILLATPRPDEAASSLVEDLVKIVTSCYGDRMDAVGIAGDVPDNLARTLSARHLIPVALIDDTNMVFEDAQSVEDRVRALDYAATLVPLRHKLSVFIVEASTSEQLKNIVLWNIRHTVWQNHMASFFILDRSPGCVNALGFLMAAWKSKLLNAKVMCYYNESGRIIVSYNPFTAKAPPPWRQLLEVFSQEDNHSFVLFSREYRQNDSICVNLDFEKTNDLGGYQVIIEGKFPGTKARQSANPHGYQYWSENDRIVATIYRTLNGTPLFTGLERWYSIDSVDIKSWAQSLVNEFHYRLMTYPREQTVLVIVSQFRARSSQPNTIFPATDIDSQFGLAIIYSIIPFFFKFFVQRPLVSAVRNLIRITCNANFSNLRRSIAPRIYLTGLLLFAISVQGFYQGHMARLLTTRIPCREVDTMADIEELGYQRVYAHPYDQITIKGSDLDKRFVDVYSTVECMEYVKRDSLAVCLWTADSRSLDLVQAFDLHVSRGFVVPKYQAFEIEYRSPLEGRFNKIIGKMAEAGLLSHRDVSRPPRYVDFRLTNIYRNKFRRNNNYQKLNLRELSFAFVILGVGLSCATVTFIAELAIGYKCRVVRRNIANGHV